MSATLGPIIPPSIVMVIYALTDSRVTVAGLFLAGVLPGLLLGQPFLTHQWAVWDSGFVIGTALLFDIGVYLAVLGSVLSLLSHYLDD